MLDFLSALNIFRSMDQFRNFLTLVLMVALFVMTWALYKKSDELKSYASLAESERMREAGMERSSEIVVTTEELRALYWALRKYGKNDPSDRVLAMLYTHRANSIIYNLRIKYHLPQNYEARLYTPISSPL